MSKRCLKATVSGRVQGVGYRRSVQKQARTHGVTGYADNLENDDVEVLLCGEHEDVETLAQWLWQGPPAAEVTHVELEETSWQEIASFETR
jgi:acylphosphatase